MGNIVILYIRQERIEQFEKNTGQKVDFLTRCKLSQKVEISDPTAADRVIADLRQRGFLATIQEHDD